MEYNGSWRALMAAWKSSRESTISYVNVKVVKEHVSIRLCTHVRKRHRPMLWGAKSCSQVQMWNSLCFWCSLEMSSLFLLLSPTCFTVTSFVCISLSPSYITTHAYAHAGTQSSKMAWMANRVPPTGCFWGLITDGKSNFSFLGKGQMFAERSSMRRQMFWGEAATP